MTIAIDMSEIQKGHGAPGRLEHMRSAPINNISRDLLITGEQLLGDSLTFPDVSCLQALFPAVTSGQVELLSKISNYTTASTGLLHFADKTDPSDSQKRQANSAAYLYLTEAQRLLGHLFPISHTFWTQYYSRHSNCFQYDVPDDHAFLETDTTAGIHHFKQRYGLYLLPLDALHYLSEFTQQLTYELLQQSLLATLTGALTPVIPPETRRRDYFSQALRLVSKLNISCLDEWITTCMLNFETPEISTS